MNNAIINFIFNSKGALKELDNFKNSFSRSIDAISNSSIGRLGRIGTALGSVFSVKSAVASAKEFKNFFNLYDNMPVDKVNQFANSISLMNGNMEEGTREALSFLGRLQDGLADLNKSQGIFTDPVVRGMFGEANIDINATDNATDVIDKIRKAYQSGLIKDTMVKDFFDKLGIGDNPDLFQFFKQDEASYQRTLANAQKMGNVSKEQVDALKKWNESVALLQGSFRRFGQSLVSGNLPKFIDKITGALDWFTSQGDGTQNAILGLIAAFTFGGPIISEVKIWTSALVEMFKATGFAFKGLLQVLSTPLGGVLGIIGGLVFAMETDMFGIRTALEETIVSFQEFVDEFSKDHPLAGSFLKQIKDFMDALAHPLDNLKTAFKNIWNIITGKGDVVDIDKMNDKLTQENLSKSAYNNKETQTQEPQEEKTITQETKDYLSSVFDKVTPVQVQKYSKMPTVDEMKTPYQPKTFEELSTSDKTAVVNPYNPLGQAELDNDWLYPSKGSPKPIVAKEPEYKMYGGGLSQSDLDVQDYYAKKNPAEVNNNQTFNVTINASGKEEGKQVAKEMNKWYNNNVRQYSNYGTMVLTEDL